MAKEQYVFDAGEFKALSSDPRLFHRELRDAIDERFPIIEPMDYYFSYVIVGVYAHGNQHDIRAFIHFNDKGDAALAKTFLP